MIRYEGLGMDMGMTTMDMMFVKVLEEDHTENRMEESLNLFRTILSYHWFK